VDALSLRNFRCFADVGPVPLRPLTLLVGENSTGKTSFLSAIRLAFDIAYPPPHPIDFNEEPFRLGAFRDIAHYRGGRSGRSQAFELAAEMRVRVKRRSLSARHSVEFRQSGSHPAITRQSLDFAGRHATVSFRDNGERPSIELRVGDRTANIESDYALRVNPESPLNWDWIDLAVEQAHQRAMGSSSSPTGKSANSPAEHLKEHLKLFPNLQLVPMWSPQEFTAPRPTCIAPIRMRPQRTYNPATATPLPEGDHVPMVLAKTFLEDKSKWASLKNALDQFGQASGLFTSLSIKSLGRHESDPFQIRIRIAGPQANLVDVGYGVSQALPILVEVLGNRSDLYLLQQPEVHMHPKAQAALGSFLATLAGAHGKQFVVETHSDYLIDRVRMDVRDGRSIKPRDVSLLFFERQGPHVVIHPMRIDADGNLLDAPDTYRGFFLAEERRFLGIA
jgi:hypothetical protein